MRDTKIEIVLFLSNLILKKVDNLQIFRNQRKKYCILIFLIFSNLVIQYFQFRNETPFKTVFWINETKIYTTTWRSRCCQLHRVGRLNTAARRYISSRQIWNICLTMVIFWICLRFRNVEIEYLRKMGICIPKYTA